MQYNSDEYNIEYFETKTALKKPKLVEGFSHVEVEDAWFCSASSKKTGKIVSMCSGATKDEALANVIAHIESMEASDINSNEANVLISAAIGKYDKALTTRKLNSLTKYFILVFVLLILFFMLRKCSN